MYIFGRDVLLKIEGYNYRNGEPTDFRDPVTFFVNIVYPNTRPFLNRVLEKINVENKKEIIHQQTNTIT